MRVEPEIQSMRNGFALQWQECCRARLDCGRADSATQAVADLNGWSRMNPSLSIVVVAYNNASELERCLTSVLAHTSTKPLELIVVDNGSSDGSAQVARSLGAHVIANPQNRGAATARNQGIDAAQGDLVLLVDSDAYVDGPVVDLAVREMERRPEVAVLGCELRFPGGQRQFSAERAMSIRMTLLRDLWLYKLVPASRRAKLLLGGYYESGDEVYADWLAAPFLLVRRRVFDECGGFNESLFPEDSEWGIRVSRAGNGILYAPSIGYVFHSGGSSQRTDPAAVMRQHHLTGIKAYMLLNGRMHAAGYWLAQLLGAHVRWCVYRIAHRLRPTQPYYGTQTSHYMGLITVYREMPVLTWREVRAARHRS